MTSRAAAELVPANQILIKRTKNFTEWMDMVEKYERVAVVGYSGWCYVKFWICQQGRF